MFNLKALRFKIEALEPVKFLSQWSTIIFITSDCIRLHRGRNQDRGRAPNEALILVSQLFLLDVFGFA